MATPIYDIARMDSVMLSSQVTGIEHVILSAVPEFIGALAATLVSSVGMWAFQKWGRQVGPEANEDDAPR
ncbi:hypothetical protein AB0D33_28135 [Streptomyces sp. NPDC048404]|uniref:hypothetical protein n=1 Tax=unclassified Streptomyces TaxID=2593676 RepID=UPI00344A2EE7